VRGIVGISGTPGTGKKTVAPTVAALMGLPAISVNSLVPMGEVEVDVRELRRAALRQISTSVVAFGHLLPHALRRPEVRLVAVLRCEPSTLRRRLVERGYPPAKVQENVEAELIGVVLDECLGSFGSELVREYDTTSTSPKEIAEAIASDAKSTKTARQARQGPQTWIDWTLDYDSSSKLRSLFEGWNEPPAST
jgi:adenylate kinase